MISTFILILLLFWSTMSFLPGVQRLITNALGITSDDSSGAGPSASGSNSSSHNSASDPNARSSVSGNVSYEPSALDVVVVKIMLTRGRKLPHEIVLSLLDHAEYWPHTTTSLDNSLTVSSGAGRENQFVVSVALTNHMALPLLNNNLPAAIKATRFHQKRPLRPSLLQLHYCSSETTLPRWRLSPVSVPGMDWWSNRHPRAPLPQDCLHHAQPRPRLGRTSQ